MIQDPSFLQGTSTGVGYQPTIWPNFFPKNWIKRYFGPRGGGTSLALLDLPLWCNHNIALFAQILCYLLSNESEDNLYNKKSQTCYCRNVDCCSCLCCTRDTNPGESVYWFVQLERMSWRWMTRLIFVLSDICTYLSSKQAYSSGMKFI